MPNTPDILSPSIPPIPEKNSAKDDVHMRLMSLARLAGQSRAQEEDLTKASNMVERFMDNVVVPVQEWCKANEDKVRTCYISISEDVPAVFVVGSSAGYDYSLSKPLAKLEMDLHGKGWACNVLQLPGGDPNLLPAFIAESTAIRVIPSLASDCQADT
jgi:hypothetical protein